MLISTVKALVDHFESKITDLEAANHSKSKAQNNIKVASYKNDGANYIIDRIQHILKDSTLQAANKAPKAGISTNEENITKNGHSVDKLEKVSAKL